MLRVVEKPTKANEELRTTLDELLQRGALKMLHEALEAEGAGSRTKALMMAFKLLEMAEDR